MKDKSAIGHLISQLGDLLQKVQNYSKPIGEIPTQFLWQLEVLEKTFKQYEELTQKTQQDANIDIDALRLEFFRSPLIHPKDKKALEKLRGIEKDARRLQAIVANSIGNQSVLSKKEKSMKERRRKFKSIGEKGWIRL